MAMIAGMFACGHVRFLKHWQHWSCTMILMLGAFDGMQIGQGWF
jgi:hypothetical protein